MYARRLRLMEALERKFAPLEKYHIDIFGICEDAREDAVYCRKKLGKTADPTSTSTQTLGGERATRAGNADPESSTKDQMAIQEERAIETEIGMNKGNEDAPAPRTIAGRRQVALERERRHSEWRSMIPGLFSRRHKNSTPLSTSTKTSKPRRRLSKVNKTAVVHEQPVVREQTDANLHTIHPVNKNERADGEGQPCVPSPTDSEASRSSVMTNNDGLGQAQRRQSLHS
ncbi:MAG: hypothetical protein Q9201_005488 [Fulgogasparrea decipioides]